LKLPEKFKFHFWLASHNVVHTLSLLHHGSIVPFVVCSRCGIQDETFLHCICDCNFSRTIWLHNGYTRLEFFLHLHDVRLAQGRCHGFSTNYLFGYCLMCLNNEMWSLHHLSFNIHNTVKLNLASHLR
jgi:hypothetical protein